MSKKVLIIGGTRFLGQYVSLAFVRNGCEVYELNRGTRPPSPGIAGQIVCDKSDRESFRKELTRRKWDIVVDTILDADDLEFVTEVLGSDVGRFIHTGSIGVYGDARRIPATESLPLSLHEGEDIVFNEKIRQDQLLTRAFVERRFPATILRMSNIYGPGDIPLDGWGGRSPRFFKAMLAGEIVPIPGDGRALLQPGHVKDLADAFVLASQAPESVGQAYNICGAFSLMLKDYVSLLGEILGVSPRMEFAPMGEVMDRVPGLSGLGIKFVCQHMCASVAKAEKELGWRPLIPLETGLRENIGWMREKGVI